MTDEKPKVKPKETKPATVKPKGGDPTPSKRAQPFTEAKLKLNWVEIGEKVESILGDKSISKIQLARMFLPVVKKHVVKPLMNEFL